MLEYKVGQAALLPVALVRTADGLAATGVSGPSVTVTMLYSDGTVVLSDGTFTWTELSTGNLAGKGEYTLLLPSSVINHVGIMGYFVSASGTDLYRGIVQVVDNTSGEIFNNVLFNRRILEGRWKIDPVANTLTAYAQDGTTPLQVWNLKDASGAATSANPFERVPTLTIP